jgi:V8-like Glu-specific endopeptidase
MSETLTGAHESVSGRTAVSREHETLDAAARIEVEKPEFRDDGGGEGWGMLENIPGFDEHAETDGIGVPIAGALLAAAPWAWIVRLRALYEDGSDASYTGWLASPRVVVTSGRCLYDPARGDAREVLVETAQEPARFWTVKPGDFRTVRGWRSGALPECDYGAVLLPGAGLTGVGHFGLAWLPADRPAAEWLNAAGYSWEAETATTQWYSGFQVEDVDDRFLRRPGGFHPASPGSPLWLYLIRNGRAQRYVCGFVTSNADRGDALRLYRDIYSNLIDWIGKAASSPEGQTPSAQLAQDG